MSPAGLPPHAHVHDRGLTGSLAFLPHACSITPDVLQHRDELSQFVGDEISRIIQEQRQLEQRYEELIAQRGTLKVRNPWPSTCWPALPHALGVVGSCE